MTLATWIDTHLLQNESTQLARLQGELRRQIAAKQKQLTDLESAIALATQQHQDATNRRASALGELAGIEQQIAILRATAATEATAAAATQSELSAAKAEQQRRATALAATEQRHSELSAELSKIEARIATAKEQLEQQQGALEQARASVEAEIAAIAATIATERERATTALSAELGAARAEVEAVRASAEQIRDDAIAAAEAEIDLARRRFEVETAAVLNTIERDKIDATKEINSDQHALLERWGPILTDPLEAEIKALEAENGRLAKLLSAKQGTSLEWQPEQIKQLLVRTLDDGSLRPNHLRIAGESESGKSHLVNQLLTSGITAMGLSCDVELYDPYPSDTNWAIAPTIADDPGAVVARLAALRELCESSSPAKRSRPLLIVLDEGDELIRQFKAEVTDSLKAILKRGRHVNLILWVMGQNGNVKGLTPMDWSDLKNAGAIYLNQVGYDYIKNGLSGRASNTLQGELDAIAAKHTYYALIHPKGAPRPYAVAVPKQLFPKATGPAPKATATAAPAQSPGALVCPKCQSSRVKKNGTALINGERRARILCHDCGKNSTL